VIMAGGQARVDPEAVGPVALLAHPLCACADLAHEVDGLLFRGLQDRIQGRLTSRYPTPGPFKRMRISANPP